MHTVIAQLVGITREQAKVYSYTFLHWLLAIVVQVLNYGRLYGAGQRFAKQFLVDNSEGMTDQKAHRAAEKLYKSTKGEYQLSVGMRYVRVHVNASIFEIFQMLSVAR